ncbi:hypothetical protein ACNKHR_08345 [Shigella flexneri]
MSLDQATAGAGRRPAKVVAVGEIGLDLLATIGNLRGSSGYSTNN